jgi:DNA-binding protein YbaB
VKYGVLWQKVEDMSKKMDKMEEQLEQLVTLANQGRGGFWVGMTIVSAISSLVGYFSHLFGGSH